MIYIFLFIGVSLRLFFYCQNTSFWLDELWLAIDIRDGSLGHSLTWCSAQPPPLFYLVEKLFGIMFGFNEMGLRFFPLLCGIASLIIFWRPFKENFSEITTLIAVGIFAICPALVQYSVTLKQYSTEVLVAVLIYWLYLRAVKKNDVSIPLYLTALISPFLSYPTVFIFPGILAWSYLAKRSRAITTYLFMIWLMSFYTCYLCFIRHINTPELASWWQSSYPIGIKGLLKAIYDFFAFMGYRFPGLILFLAVIGLWRGKNGLFYGLPLLFCCLAIGLHKYPYTGRLLLWAVPGVLIWSAEGFGYLTRAWYESK